MNFLQTFKATPFTQGIGITGDNYEMLKRLATNRGAPAMQQNGMGLNTANSTPVSMIPTPQFPQTSSNANAPVVQSNGATTDTTDTTNTELRRENIDAPPQNQTDPKQVSDFANSLYSSLGKGLTYTNPTAGGSAIDQLSALQAQQANDKVNRTGMYAIDKNAGFSPQQISQQEGSADQFYTEQKGKYGTLAQKELAALSKTGTSSLLGTGTFETDLDATIAKAVSTIPTKFKQEAFVNAMSRARNDSDKISIMASTVLGNADAATRTDFINQSVAIKQIDKAIRAIDEGAKTGFLNNAAQYGFNIFGKDYDPKLTEVAGYITSAIQPYRNSVTGAAWGDQEDAEYNTLFGSTRYSPEELKSRLERIREIMVDKSIGALDAEIDPLGAIGGGSTFGDSPDMNGVTKEDARAAMEAGIITPKEFEELNFNSVGNTQVSIPQSSRISYVNNNPGNLVYAGQEGAKRGEKRGDGTYWAKFSTPDAGFNALENQVKLDASRGLTLNSFINKYAPSSENDTKTYVAQVSQRLGVDPRTPISQIDTRELAKEIARKESNTRIL